MRATGNMMTRLAALVLLLAPVLNPTGTRAAEPRPIVAVLEIEDRGSGLDADVLDRLSDYLAVLMAEAGYAVVPREQVRARLVDLRKESYKSCYDQKCQIELGRELAAQKVLAPKVLQIGGECRLLGTLLDLKLAASEKAATAKATCNERGMLLAVEKLVAKLTGRQASVSGRPRPQSPQTTSAPEPTPAPDKNPPAPAQRRRRAAGKPKPAGRKPAAKNTNLLKLGVGVLYPHLADALTLDSGDRHGEVASGTGVMVTARFDFGTAGATGMQVYLGGVMHFLWAKDSADDDAFKYYVLGMGTTASFPLADWLELRLIFDVGLGVHVGTEITMTGTDSSGLSISELGGVVFDGVVELAWKLSPGLVLLVSAGALGEVYGTYNDSNGEHDFKFPPHLFTTLGLETSY